MNSSFYISESQLPENYILLVDDDDDDRFQMNEFFMANGYTCQMLSSGLAAIQFLQLLSPAFYPSLIILDYAMPLLNGEEVLLFIKSSTAFENIPVIIYSSEMNDYLKSRLKECGAYTCFSKAYKTSQLDDMNRTIESLLLSKGI
ncbi:MAG TPA: response regulator [Flavitalea sp.]|nr:response regulator [Flavitalea sp.]